jgi:excisionase family DNA binding protein
LTAGTSDRGKLLTVLPPLWKFVSAKNLPIGASRIKIARVGEKSVARGRFVGAGGGYFFGFANLHMRRSYWPLQARPPIVLRRGEMNNRLTEQEIPTLDGMTARVMTVQDVSAYLRVHPSTVYRLLKRNELPAFRVGSDWRFNVEAIDRWRSRMEAGGQVLNK